MKDILRIREISGPRFEIALGQLAEGPGFTFNDVWIRIDGTSGLLCCEAISQGRTFPGRDIARAKDTLEHLRSSSPRFAELVAGLETRFSTIEIYGMGTIELCREVDGELRWLVKY